MVLILLVLLYVCYHRSVLPHAVAHDIIGELTVLTLGNILPRVVAYGINGDNNSVKVLLSVCYHGVVLPPVVAHVIN